jgi:two-component system sensor histidine kinase PilS (NtrC family)
MAKVFAAQNIGSLVRGDRFDAMMGWSGSDAASADSKAALWRPLYLFNLYRVASAGVFLLAMLPQSGGFKIGLDRPSLFVAVGTAYLVIALLFLTVLPRLRLGFNLVLTIEVISDILLLTLMMHASGGARSGLGYMVLVVLAGAGLVGQGRQSLFYAALATLAVLFEQAYRVSQLYADPADFVYAGSISSGFFATAITARLLAARVVANEELASQRGHDLDDQLNINRQVIRDMQDGVLVVDASGKVRQFNPQALTLLSVQSTARDQLADFSATLAERLARWRGQANEVTEAIRVPASGRLLRARYLPAGDGGNALIYLEDLERIHAETQQLKLAALGRLTANMAHEIRNPLSAISHAAELLAEGVNAETQTRLTRIIGDNTQRLNRLVGEVLELGRRDQARPETIRLAGFVEAFVEDLALREPKARESVATDVAVDSAVSFDRSHLNRILWNLTLNALRSCSGKAGSVMLRVTVATDSVELHVIDDGPGIDPKLRAQVFEPFFTTHGSGTGLGLYIARELCEANGASLTLRDHAPGAHFCISGRGGAWPQETNDAVEANRAAS